MNSDRDAWTAYAERVGLVRPDPPVRPPDPGAPVTPPASRRNKYRAEPVTVDGVRFASRKEGARYLELRLLEKHGAIAELELQPCFPLHIVELYRSINWPIRIATPGVFRADFRYLDLTSGEIVVEDTKSDATKTEAYRLRKRIAEAVHGMTVTEL